MHLFEDLKGLEEELKNYLALYNIVLSPNRIAYHAELLEDRMLNKEPIIKYLEDLVHTITKEEPSAFHKNAFFIWKREHPDLTADEAFEQFSVWNEAQKQKRLDRKEYLIRRKEAFQKKKDDKIKAQYLLSIYSVTNQDTQILSIDINDFSIKEHKTLGAASLYVGLKTSANLYTYSNRGNLCQDRYMVRIINTPSNE